MTSTKFTDPTREVAIRVKELRKARGWSAQRLSTEMARIGCPIERSVLANFESGRRSKLTVVELYAFAHLLGVNPWELASSEPPCETCRDTPPVGYTCNTCGASA